MVLRLVALLTSLIYLDALTAFACETVTAQQVADALNSAQGLQSGLKSCSMAAMAMIESGGNTCAHNACCVGILQLNLGPTGLGWSQGAIDAYRNADLQTQVDGWVQTANSNTSSWGYQTLLASYSADSPIDGYKVTGGTLAACEQFGAVVCNHNVQSLQSAGGCGSYTDGAGHTGGQTVCSWGQHADQQAANQNCTLNGSKSKGGTSCPTNSTTPGTIISPSPGNAPVSLPPNLA
jgi:hypothetical protein